MSRRPQKSTRRTSASSRPTSPPREFHVPETSTPALPPVADFGALDMPAALTKTLAAQGVTVPFPIQAATLPNALAGRDVLGRGRTGSGKTLAFGLALLARTAGHRAEPKAPLALVLVPTRELAQQVADALAPYATALNLRLASVVGGLSVTKQAATLRRGTDVLVATPGRLNDLVARGDCLLGDVRVTVLDEADQMADMGFLPQITQVMRQVPADGQRLLFSATLDATVDKLVQRFLTDPVVHSVDPNAGAVVDMEHHLLHVLDETDKKAVTTRIAARDGRVILFLDTKRAADRLAKRLLSQGVLAAALHGDRSQSQRTRTLEQFRDGRVTALVATNVAARGIHVDDLDLVVNVDPPTDPKDYLHRGGRTARAGSSGSVVTLVLPDQKREVSRLMTDAGIRARTTQVTSSAPELSAITGAREPSGVPAVLEVPQPAQPKASSSRPARKKATGGRGAGAGGGGEQGAPSSRRRRTTGGRPKAAGTETHERGAQAAPRGQGGRAGQGERAAQGARTGQGGRRTGQAGQSGRAGQGGRPAQRARRGGTS
ncbi:DEAD/DEAH box helicase [Streptomyces sp. NPDC006339]|uniref:DEAD/DEAH box helicase n=1 Tax=Streptomyces sp. NPDC006339 TaxID=3156755 RepID=UPI0033B5E13E